MTMRGSGTTMESKANIKNGMIRLVFTAVAVLLEVVLMLGMFLTGLGRYLVLGICSQNKTASIKMTCPQILPGNPLNMCTLNI